jgi:iron complex transport system ATP-binding protein
MIDIDGVSVTFGDLRVLDGVDLAVEPGEFVALVGPNGAGKTTLLRTITGVLTPDAGTISVAGTSLASQSSKEVSRSVAIVPQDTHVGFSFTAEHIVEMGRTPYRSRLDWGRDTDPVERAMERTETLQFRDKPVDDLSGGERQRVLLARALAQEPDALLLDEPTGSLDINHQIRVLDLLTDLVDEGRAALAAIHDLDLAARFCDRLVLLHDGAIQASGPPAQVLDDPTLGSAFETETAVTENPVTGAPTVSAINDRPDEDGRVHVVGSGTGARRAIRALWRAGFEVTLGPVHDGDVAAELADSLDLQAVTVPAFERPTARHRSDIETLTAGADIVVQTAGIDDAQLTEFDGDQTDASASPFSFDDVPLIRADLGGSGSRAARGDGGEVAIVDSEADLLDAVRDCLGMANSTS